MQNINRNKCTLKQKQISLPDELFERLRLSVEPDDDEDCLMYNNKYASAFSTCDKDERRTCTEAYNTHVSKYLYSALFRILSKMMTWLTEHVTLG